MRILFLLTIAIAVTPSRVAHAQERPATVTYGYRVDITVRDASVPAAKPGRRYTMLMEPGSKSVVRLGTKVPYTTSSTQGGGGTVTAQYNYADVGVNIDARIRDVNEKVGLNADLDLSSLVQHEGKSTTTTLPMPTIATSRIWVYALLTPGKPAVIASIDDPVTGHRFDVEATVTKSN